MDNREEFEARLKEQSPEMCAAIAARAALRVWPLTAVAGSEDLFGRDQRARLALASVRGLLTASVALIRSDAQVRTAAGRAAKVIEAVARDVNAKVEEVRYAMSVDTADAVAIASVGAASGDATEAAEGRHHPYGNAFSAFDFAARAIEEVRGKFSETYTTANSHIYGDVTDSYADLVVAPLWYAPGTYDDTTERLLRHIDALGSDFDFWRRWYRALSEGRQLDVELQRRIALIEDDVWTGEDAPRRVAQRIAQIEALYELEKRIAELEAQLEAVNEMHAAPNRLHNNPPYPIELEETLALQQRERLIVYEGIEELKEEIAKQEPRPSVLERIANLISAASKRLAQFSLVLAGATITAASVAWGKTVGNELGQKFIDAGSLDRVVDAIRAFAETLPPG